MRLAFFGDVMGRSGRSALESRLGELREALALDFVVVNAENAAGGYGVTEAVAEGLLAAGADVLTLGNHSWDQREAITYIERQSKLLRPVNYPQGCGAPGQGAGLFETADGRRVLVMNVLGRLFMDALDCPFAAVERELGACPLGEAADAVIVDIHAEATSEKGAMGHFCDGRASLVVGTHTHIPTADAQILPHGTAYQTDAGMCGDYVSVIGMNKDKAVAKMTTRMPQGRLDPAEGAATVCGVFVETDDATGLALRCEPIRVGGALCEALPKVSAAARAAAE